MNTQEQLNDAIGIIEDIILQNNVEDACYISKLNTDTIAIADFIVNAIGGAIGGGAVNLYEDSEEFRKDVSIAVIKRLSEKFCQ